MNMDCSVIKRLIILSAAIFLIFAGKDFAQEPGPNEGVTYLEAMGEQTKKIRDEMWEYVKTSAHVKDAAQVDAKRNALIQVVRQAIDAVKEMKPFNGNADYKNAVLKYMNTMHYMLVEDYAKIVNMEEIAEQSYDLMEAYILAKEKAGQKLDEEIKKIIESEKKFAKDNNINLIITEDETNKKLNISNSVIKYNDKIYLIFFKSYKQELYLLDALQSEDVNKIEQNRLTLIKYSDEGLGQLAAIDPYENDLSLKQSCEKLLAFYNDEANNKMSDLTDMFIKRETFEKIKKAFDLKQESERTQEDISLYNGKVNDLNDAVKKYNKTNKSLNKNRGKLIEDWNKKNRAFMDKHVPK